MILDSMALPVLVLDKECNIIRINTPAERLTGHYRSKLLGHRCDKVFKPRPCGPDCPVQKVLQASATRLFSNMKILTADGHTLAVDTAISPLSGPRGRIIGAVQVLMDRALYQRPEEPSRQPLRVQQVAQERAVILKAINNASGNLSRAAKELGIHRTTLWRKLRSLGISR